MGANTIRTFIDFGPAPTATQILDELYRNNIMVIMTVDRAVANSANITPTVNAYKNHPAILMWAIGNEWDLNHYYHPLSTTLQSAAFTEWAAQVIHSLDPNHPVASILADIDRGAQQPLLPLPWSLGITSTQQIVGDLAPSVDVWGLGIYRGATFGGLFGQWQQISAKPVFVAEFGADAYDHRIGAQNQPMQSDFDDQLWKEIFLHLSSRWPDQPGLGGLIFEWNDEWWKNGNACAQDITGETNPGQPDGYNDEDWFGIVNIDRQRRQVFDGLRRNFFSNAVLTTTNRITLSAYSGLYSQFFKNEAGFCYKMGGGGGGRGVNMAVVDPKTGAIDDCRNFDTWYDKRMFVTMANYISDTISPGRIVLAAIADEGGFIRYGPPESDCHVPWAIPEVEIGYRALETLGSTQIRHVGYWGSWAMIAIKGQGKLAEGHGDPDYNPPSNGFCQLKSRVSISITATTPITLMYPGYRTYLPSIYSRLP